MSTCRSRFQQWREKIKINKEHKQEKTEDKRNFRKCIFYGNPEGTDGSFMRPDKWNSRVEKDT